MILQNNQQYYYKIGVVDYESKPIDKLEAWYEQEQELIRAYKEYLVNNHRKEKKCGNY